MSINKLENLPRTDKQTHNQTENSKTEATLIPVDSRGERANNSGTCIPTVPYYTPPFKDYLDSNQGEKNLVWPIFLFDLSCAKSIILANSVGNPQRNSHFKCLFYKKISKLVSDMRFMVVCT